VEEGEKCESGFIAGRISVPLKECGKSLEGGEGTALASPEGKEEFRKIGQRLKSRSSGINYKTKRKFGNITMYKGSVESPCLRKNQRGISQLHSGPRDRHREEAKKKKFIAKSMSGESSLGV